MWHVTPSGRFDWPALRARVASFGMRNSLLMAPMPTASTAQILGNNESIEPFTSNMYSRRVLAGDFAMVNRHLMRDLIDLGIWNESVRNHIIADQGSVQKIPAIPTFIKELYKTVRRKARARVLTISSTSPSFPLDVGVGDQAAIADRHVSRPRRFHLPVSVAEPLHRGT
jgi:ribonucleotide reductase alpha subunit